MLISGNIEWGRQIYPKLPDEILVELVEMLAALHPKTPWTSERPSERTERTEYSFPFMDIPEDFDHEEWETWTFMVEDDIAERHSLSHQTLTWW